MSARSLAFDRIKLFKERQGDELRESAFKVLVAATRGGQTFVNLEKLYEGEIRRLAEKCLEAFRWADTQAVLVGEYRAESEWSKFCTDQLRDMYEHSRDALDSTRLGSMGSVANTDPFAAARQSVLETLKKAHSDIQKEFLQDLAEEIESSKRKARAATVGGAAKFGWAIMGGIITFAVTMTVSWIQKPPSSYQRSSPVVSSTPTRTPQTSGTQPPSVHPSGGSPPATRPGLATPSSTRQP